MTKNIKVPLSFMTRKIRLTFNKLLDLESDLTVFRDQSIGSGSFGEVYKCIVKKNRRQKEDREGAIKFISNDKLMSSKLQQGFHNELACQDSLKHPAILDFIGYTVPLGQGISQFSVVTPYMPNGSLHQVLFKEGSGNCLPAWNNTKRVINILGIACGMAYIHQQKIIHRDLKTENILLDDDYYPKICDFGVSKVFDEGAAAQVHMTINVGTPLYMAPEIVDGQQYGNKIDVFAYAMVLYELFMLELPWYNQKKYFNLPKYLAEGLRPTMDERVPDLFRNLINECWEGDPEVRPSFAIIVAKFRDNLTEVLESIGNDVETDEISDYFDEASKGLDLPDST